MRKSYCLLFLQKEGSWKIGLEKNRNWKWKIYTHLKLQFWVIADDFCMCDQMVAKEVQSKSVDPILFAVIGLYCLLICSRSKFWQKEWAIQVRKRFQFIYLSFFLSLYNILHYICFCLFSACVLIKKSQHRLDLTNHWLLCWYSNWTDI